MPQFSCICYPAKEICQVSEWRNILLHEFPATHRGLSSHGHPHFVVWLGEFEWSCKETKGRSPFEHWGATNGSPPDSPRADTLFIYRRAVLRDEPIGEKCANCLHR